MSEPSIETIRQREQHIQILTNPSIVAAFALTKRQTLTQTRVDLLKKVVIPVIRQEPSPLESNEEPVIEVDDQD